MRGENQQLHGKDNQFQMCIKEAGSVSIAKVELDSRQRVKLLTNKGD
jgi:hypothetical protein